MKAFARLVALWAMVLFITALLTVQWSWTAIAFIGAATGATFITVFVSNLIKLRWEHAGAVVDTAPGRLPDVDLADCDCMLDLCDEPATYAVPGYSSLRACEQHAPLVRLWVGGAAS